MSRAVRRIVFAFAAAWSLGACAGVEVISGTDGSGTGSGPIVGTGPVWGGGGGSTSTQLLGTWTRAILLADDVGNVHESRTTWEFRQDGSAIRNVIAWNLTQGYYDTIVTVAQWRTTGSQLTITYIAPALGTAAYAFSINGDILTIGPDQYARIR
jgi:hypothetical protein